MDDTRADAPADQPGDQPDDRPDAVVAPPAGPTRRRRGRIALYVVSGIAIIVGVVLLAVGVRAFDHADDTRGRAAVLRRQRRALVARTHVAERDVDAPISDAERVAKSVTTIVSTSDAVIVESAATNQLLGQAVSLVNRGQHDRAQAIYTGDAARSVQRLNDSLAQARAALAAAQAAAGDLAAETP